MWFSLQHFSETSLILRRSEPLYDHKFISVFMQSTRYSCKILMKLPISRPIFENPPNTKFHENPSHGSWGFPCRWTEGQTDGQTRQCWKSLFAILRTRQQLVHNIRFRDSAILVSTRQPGSGPINRDTSPGMDRTFFSSIKRPDRLGNHYLCYSMGTGWNFSGGKAANVRSWALAHI